MPPRTTAARQPSHPVFFIGAGPGALHHLTLQGRDCIRKSRLVLAPNIYRDTFKPVLRGKTVVEPFMFLFDEIVALIDAHRAEAPVSVLLPGDNAVFSPFQPLVDHYGVEGVVIPGVGTFNAAAAELRKTMDLPNVANTTVLTSTRSLKAAFEDHDFMRYARPDASLVLFMNHIPLPELTARLIPAMGKDCPIAIIYKVSMPDQEVVRGTLATIARKVRKDYFESSRKPSMALVIIGHVLKARAARREWDYRKKQIWDKRDK